MARAGTTYLGLRLINSQMLGNLKSYFLTTDFLNSLIQTLTIDSNLTGAVQFIKLISNKTEGHPWFHLLPAYIV